MKERKEYPTAGTVAKGEVVIFPPWRDREGYVVVKLGHPENTQSFGTFEEANQYAMEELHEDQS